MVRLSLPAFRRAYAHVEPNRFQSAWDHPLSTFGADVDTASYANVRRFLSQGQLPPRDAVRVEEFVNYFKFDYDVPRDGHPIAITTEVGDCPWAPAHKLVLIGARARAARPREIAGRNIVLLIDVSGSMAPADRLPLLKSALRMFVDTLQPDDRLAIVTYAGTSGIALPSTPAPPPRRDPARDRESLRRRIDQRRPGAHHRLSRRARRLHLRRRQSRHPRHRRRLQRRHRRIGSELLQLIQRERESGVFLSVLGVGTGNLKDATMEMLADRGNGHYAYLDSLQEARRVLVREADATLENVAKDVKFQVEFNPALVSEWKLIGYENRLMAAQDFNNDQKDGGEMGAGHTVTVLYEVVPVGVERPTSRATAGRTWIRCATRRRPPRAARRRNRPQRRRRDGRRVADREGALQAAGRRDQPAHHARGPGGGGRVRHLPLASAVAEFGLLLRAGTGSTARWNALAARVGGCRRAPVQTVEVAGFVELVEIARGLSRGTRR